MISRPGSLAVVAAAGVVVALLCGCDYARMTNDEALQTHEVALPPMPPGTVPVQGGEEPRRKAEPRALKSPFAPSLRLVHTGKIAYGSFCVHCHGPDADGNGTVGQSFAPLPADLAGPGVRGQTDGELFAKISFGYLRHPPLADTVSEADRWAVVAYLRSLPPRRPR